MSRMEEVLRAATRETAAEVLPDSIPPLDTATLPVPRRLAWRIGGPLSPLYAAVAVVLVAALSVTLAAVVPAHRTPAAPGFAGVPPYYITLTPTGYPAAQHPAALAVRSTFGGQMLAATSAPPPYGTFTLVDGTADNRTFLVAAQAWRPRVSGPGPVPTRLFWARYDPAGGSTAASRIALTPLPIPQFDGEWMRAASVSPDGTRVAILFRDLHTLTDSIRTDTLATGAERTWSVSAVTAAVLPGIGVTPNNPAAIAWGADDRTISWVWNSNPLLGVMVLDTASASSELDSASAMALPWDAGYGSTPGGGTFECETDMFQSANGKYFLCGGYTVPGSQRSFRPVIVPAGPVTQGFAVFSPTPLRLISVIGVRYAPLNPSALPYLLWASPNASTLIGLVDGHAVVVSDGQTRPLPWPAGVLAPPGSAMPGAAW